MNLISIVVPVYNTEKYLDQCIQSVLAQTYTNWELLLIDDGSTDSSGAICDKYAAEDNRIRVYHKENGGVSAARNTGIDNTYGEWITFLDSDDWFETSSLEILYNETKKNDNIDICWGAFRIVDFKNNESQVIKKTANADIINSLMTGFTPSTGCLVRTALLQEKHLRYPIGIKYCEDVHLMGRLLYYCRSAITIENIVYNYRMQLSSVIHNLNTTTQLDEQWVCNDLIKFYKSQGVYNKYRRTMNHRLLKASQELVLHPNSHERFVDLCHDITILDIVSCEMINIKLKLMALLLLNHCGSVVVAINLIRKLLKR